jgi:hypothetical protein
MMVQTWTRKATAENLHGRPFLRTTGLHYLSLPGFCGCVVTKR